MKTLRIISRTIVGLTFMFSGFVKGVDPLGFNYKLREYFEVYNMEWLRNAAVALAIILFIIEFTLGVMLVFGVKPKLTSWLAFIMMSFFLVLTFISAIYNPVSDCGCFGDAIKLSNWATFYKNVVLVAIVLFLVFTNKYATPAFKPKWEYLIMIIGAGCILFVSVFSLRHLPLIDFLPWKVGNNVLELMKGKTEVFLVYEDNKTKQRFEYTDKTLPWKDSVKMNSMHFIDQENKIIQEIKIGGFAIVNDKNVAITDSIIGNPSYQFLLVAYDLSMTKKKAFDNINKFVEVCDKDKMSFIGLTGASPEKADAFRHDMQAMFPFYTVDETALKTMIRSNPGLLLLHNGVVIAKWGWRDIPEYKVVKEKYIK